MRRKIITFKDALLPQKNRESRQEVKKKLGKGENVTKIIRGEAAFPIKFR